MLWNGIALSSSELKAQASFSYRLLSVVRPSVRLSVCRKLFKFSSSSPELLGQFQPNLCKVCSNEGPRPFPRGDNYEIAKIF